MVRSFYGFIFIISFTLTLIIIHDLTSFLTTPRPCRGGEILLTASLGIPSRLSGLIAYSSISFLPFFFFTFKGACKVMKVFSLRQLSARLAARCQLARGDCAAASMLSISRRKIRFRHITWRFPVIMSCFRALVSATFNLRSMVIPSSSKQLAVRKSS